MSGEDLKDFVLSMMKSKSAYASDQAVRRTASAQGVQRRRVRRDGTSDDGELFVRSNSVTNIARFTEIEERVVKVTVDPDSGRLIDEVLRIMHGHRIDLAETSEPSKKSVRQAVSTRHMLPTNRVFKGMPGDSRNRTVDAIRAIAADHTGTVVTDRVIPRIQKATTSRGDGNVMAGYQRVERI